MTLTGDAGRSAAARAEALRRQAAERERRAWGYEQGAKGERLTAEVLAMQGDPGWKVFHDLRLPGRQANVDHLVVTPAGVFVIDSKHWSTPAREGAGTLWTGRYHKRNELATLSRSVTAVRHLLAGGSAPVRAVISLTNAPPATRLLRAGEVEAVGVQDLVGYLRAQPPTLHPADVDAIAGSVASVLAGGRPHPHGFAGAVPPPPWSPPPPHQPPTRPAPSPGPPPRSPRSSRRRPSPLLRLLPPLIVLIGGVIAYGIISSFAHRMGSSILRSLPTTTTVPAAPLAVQWSCPAPGQGWTATIVWPAGTTVPPDWEIETAPASTGPWTVARTGFSGTAAALTHLMPGAAEWVRAGSVWSMPGTGHALTSGELTPPAGC